MAAPVDSARQGTNITAASTSHAINVGSPVAGTLLLVFIRFAGAPGAITFTGYTSIANDSSDASDDTTAIYYRQADGTEGATDTLTTGSSVKLAAICWEVTGAADPATTAPTVSTVAVTTGLMNANSVAPPGAPVDTLYIVAGGYDGEGTAMSSLPTGYSNLITADSGTGGAAASNCRVGGGSKQATSSSSDDPDNAWGHGSPNAGAAAFTVAIPAPVAGGTTYTKAGFGKESA